MMQHSYRAATRLVDRLVENQSITDTELHEAIHEVASRYPDDVVVASLLTAMALRVRLDPA